MIIIMIIVLMEIILYLYINSVPYGMPLRYASPVLWGSLGWHGSYSAA